MSEIASGRWEKVTTDYEFELFKWQHEIRADILVIEQRLEPWHDDNENPDHQLHMIPESDSEPIRTLEGQVKDIEEVIGAARDYMAENE